MAWCLTKEFSNKFLNGIKSGEINPEKLTSITSSEERRKYLSKFVGEENSKKVNTEFEKKLLLKNQQRGIISWAKKTGGLKEGPKNDILLKVKKLSKALDPESESGILSDVIESRLGISVGEKEATKITELAKKADDLYNPNLENFKQSNEYWKTKQELVKYLRESTPETISSGIWDKLRKNTASLLSIERAVKTGFDLSAPGRQGRAYIGTRDWNGAFKRMFSYAKDATAMDELEIKMMSNRYSEQALKYKRQLGLTILGEGFTQREEQFASKFIDKVPILAGSERAFVGFLNDLRFNRFVRILDNLEKSGKGITDNPEAMENLAKVIGAATGRGTLGGAEGAARSLSTVLFSPRWLASRIQTLTNTIYSGGFTGPAVNEARMALARIVGTSAAILGLAKLAGADVEVDPRSSDFGKAKIGKTRFDVTGGLAPFVTLFSRVVTLSTKSTTTGEINNLMSGKYGAPNALDVVTDFFINKTSPVASVVRDTLKGKTFEGKKLNPKTDPKGYAKYLADQLLTPLFSSDILDAYRESSGNLSFTLASGASSAFGVGVNTYNSGNIDWSQSESKELGKFKEKIGETKFQEANNKFNDIYAKKMKAVIGDERYKKLSADEKTSVLTKLKNNIKDDMFKEYGFTYKYEMKPKSEIDKINELAK